MFPAPFRWWIWRVGLLIGKEKENLVAQIGAIRGRFDCKAQRARAADHKFILLARVIDVFQVCAAADSKVDDDLPVPLRAGEEQSGFKPGHLLITNRPQHPSDRRLNIPIELLSCIQPANIARPPLSQRLSRLQRLAWIGMQHAPNPTTSGFRKARVVNRVKVAWVPESPPDSTITIATGTPSSKEQICKLKQDVHKPVRKTPSSLHFVLIPIKSHAEWLGSRSLHQHPWLQS
jgi:hypothetical protein